MSLHTNPCAVFLPWNWGDSVPCPWLSDTVWLPRLDHKKFCSFYLGLLENSLLVWGIFSLGNQLPWKESNYPDTTTMWGAQAMWRGSIDNEIPREEAKEHSVVKEVPSWEQILHPQPLRLVPCGSEVNNPIKTSLNSWPTKSWANSKSWFKPLNLGVVFYTAIYN